MLRFPAVWLRDNCPCAECLDPRQRGEAQGHHRAAGRRGGQRGQHRRGRRGVGRGHVRAGPAPLRLPSLLAGRARARRPRWRRARRRRARRRRADRGRQGTVAAGRLPPTPLCPRSQLAGLPGRPRGPGERPGRGVRSGFVLLHDVPAEPGMVLEVAASFGFVRETNYGLLFDVRVEPRPGNLAFTSRRILPHTDINPVPGSGADRPVAALPARGGRRG